jgi:hypothetical protein
MCYDFGREYLVADDPRDATEAREVKQKDNKNSYR